MILSLIKMLRIILSLGFLKSYKKTFKEIGFRGLVQKEGWSIVFVFIVFYLIRDTLIFIIIPYISISGLSSCF